MVPKIWYGLRTLTNCLFTVLLLGLLFFDGDYILLYGGTPTFWQRGLWGSCFQNHSESFDHFAAFHAGSIVNSILCGSIQINLLYREQSVLETFCLHAS